MWRSADSFWSSCLLLKHRLRYQQGSWACFNDLLHYDPMACTPRIEVINLLHMSKISACSEMLSSQILSSSVDYKESYHEKKRGSRNFWSGGKRHLSTDIFTLQSRDRRLGAVQLHHANIMSIAMRMSASPRSAYVCTALYSHRVRFGA